MSLRFVLVFFTFVWAAVATAEGAPDASKILSEGTILNSTISDGTRFTSREVSIWWVGYEGKIYQCFADLVSFGCTELQANDQFVQSLFDW
jgi:hypothetical protein